MNLLKCFFTKGSPFYSTSESKPRQNRRPTPTDPPATPPPHLSFLASACVTRRRNNDRFPVTAVSTHSPWTTAAAWLARPDAATADDLPKLAGRCRGICAIDWDNGKVCVAKILSRSKAVYWCVCFLNNWATNRFESLNNSRKNGESITAKSLSDVSL